MMLRKSFSTEWQSTGGLGGGSMMTDDHHHYSHGSRMASESSAHATALFQHVREIKDELNSFQGVFDQWLAMHRQVLTEDKEAYLKTLSEEQDLVEALKKQLTTLVAKRQSVVAALQAEQKEFEESQRLNKDLETQKQSLSKRLASLQEESQKLKAQLQEQEKELKQLREESQLKDAKETLQLKLSEEYLGLYVEPLSGGMTKFSFKYIDPADWERRFSIIIDISTNRYRVNECKPMFSHLNSLVDRLNEDGEFFSFLQDLRQAFVESVRK